MARAAAMRVPVIKRRWHDRFTNGRTVTRARSRTRPMSSWDELIGGAERPTLEFVLGPSLTVPRCQARGRAAQAPAGLAPRCRPGAWSHRSRCDDGTARYLKNITTTALAVATPRDAVTSERHLDWTPEREPLDLNHVAAQTVDARGSSAGIVNSRRIAVCTARDGVQDRHRTYRPTEVSRGKGSRIKREGRQAVRGLAQEGDE
jgi:hypothetical protein